MPKVTYLQMCDRGELRPRHSSDRLFDIREVTQPQPELNRFLYQLVGAPWQWTDKLIWDDAAWKKYASRVRTFVAMYGGNIAGYYELGRDSDDRSAQICYFGLVPDFVGRRLGGPLLTHALEQAWGWSVDRVWVHTCDLDHPAALQNYLARGMSIYRVADE